MKFRPIAFNLQPARAVMLLAVATVASILVSVSLLLWDLHQSALERAQQQTFGLTRLLARQLGQGLGAADQALRDVQQRMQQPFESQQTLDGLPFQLLLRSRLPSLGQVGSLFIVDASGHVVNTTLGYPVRPIPVGDRDYFSALASGRVRGLFIGTPVQSRIDGAWTLYLARRVDRPDGSLRGLVVAAIPTPALNGYVRALPPDFRNSLAIYLRDGTLVSSLPQRDADIGRPAPELRDTDLTQLLRLGQFVRFDANDVRHRYALAAVPDFPLLVSLDTNERFALGAWREVALPIGFGAILVSLVIGMTARFLARQLHRREVLDRALVDADRRYRLTIDSVMDAIVSIDDSLHIVLFNTAAEAMFGWSAAQAIGQPLDILIPPRLRQQHRAHMRAFAESDVVSREMAPQFEISGVRRDGSEFPIESAVSQTRVDGRLQLTAVLRDVTERRRREAKLRDMNQELRRLSMTLQSVREEERGRLSRELHDDLGQQLTGLKLELSWLSSRVREGRIPPQDKFDAMRRQLDEAIVAVRRISTELRPRILDDLDFSEALTWHCNDIAQRSGLQIGLRLGAAEWVHGDALATALFRIVQEALTNVLRHAGASRVDIELRVDSGQLLLQICDDGKGFDPTERRAGIGLLSMRERAVALGGEFNIHGKPGQGTCIEVRIPLDGALGAQA